MTAAARHILVFARDLRGGGVERAMLRMAAGWLAAGRRVTLVLGSAAGPLAAELPAGIKTVALGAASLRPLLRGVPAVVRAVRPDILFCPGNAYTVVAAAARLQLGRGCPPIVAKMSNAPDRADHDRVTAAAHRVWLSWHGGFLDHLVGMTPETATVAARALRMAGRITVIPNPPARAIPGATLPPLPAGRFILGVGRLVAQKRWDRLIAALPLLADRAVPLVLLGEGEQRAALTALAARLGVAARVAMPGHAADPLAVMAQAQVVALTSDFEGVPGVLREALSVGAPVVATDSSPSVREIVADPAWGDVVALDDMPALVAALDRWLSPAAHRPDPVAPPGADAADRYLALFDRIVARR